MSIEIRRAVCSPFCYLLVISSLVAFTSSCDFFPESTFQLASNCRLPKWFDLPSGVSRANVSVELNTFVKKEGRIAKFTLYAANKATIASATGTMKGLQPVILKNPNDRYPTLYDVVTVGETTDVIEYDAPKFCMVESPRAQ